MPHTIVGLELLKTRRSRAPDSYYYLKIRLMVLCRGASHSYHQLGLRPQFTAISTVFFLFFLFFYFFLILQNIWMMLFRRLKMFWKKIFFWSSYSPSCFFSKKISVKNSVIHTVHFYFIVQYQGNSTREGTT